MYAKALWAFPGENETELPLAEGQRVVLTREVTEFENWYYGVTLDGRAEGYFPSNYVEIER